MIEKKMYSTKKVKDKAILVAIFNQKQPKDKTLEYINELEELALTAGIDPVKKIYQNLEKPNSATFIGSGKLNEVKNELEYHQANTIIFDDDLNASQVKNLEKILDCKILDRTLLILDIFSLRAKTAQAKIQVELAQYQYLLPRLTRLWTHLTKQKGGSPGMRGPGEKELETDKRIIQDKIFLLKKKLSHINTQKQIESKNRSKLARVSLVGYTNAGKSTLMNILSKEKLEAEDKLFATITSTVRKVVIDKIPFLLTDTVGFIRKLPTLLIESFKSTLYEIDEADLLLHVIDFSSKSYLDHIETVNSTLREIGVDKPIILVFNKIDLLKINFDENEFHKEFKKKYNYPVIFISAKQKLNIELLKKLIYKHIKKHHLKIYPNYLKN